MSIIFFEILEKETENPVYFHQFTQRLKTLIKHTMIKNLTILKVKNPLEMTLLFSMLDKDTGSVCAGKMELIGGWRCLDCVKNENAMRYYNM